MKKKEFLLSVHRMAGSFRFFSERLNIKRTDFREASDIAKTLICVLFVGLGLVIEVLFPSLTAS